ncbi:MAG: SRPBCC domain-containing protein [Gallionella sp.]
MSARKNNDAASTAGREIVITRTFDAPRELIWEAMTNPEHVVNWWGPNGFSTTIEKMDLRVGGVWKHVMHGPDGSDYPNKSVFTDIVKPERIEYSHGGGRKGDPAAQFDATWTFEALGKQTKVTIHMLFPTAADRDTVVKTYGAIEGGKQTLARLADFLPKMAFIKADLVITRIFDAPRALMWKAWTDPKQVAQWWGPHGFTNPLCEWDARPGGAILVHMRGPAGSAFDMVMPMKGMFHEVTAPKRLVFTSTALEDAAGNPQLETLNTITFEEYNGKTRLTLNAKVVKAMPAAAGAISGMEQGWSQSLERLDALLQ